MTVQPEKTLRGAIDAIGNAAKAPRPYERLADVQLAEPPRRPRSRSRSMTWSAVALFAAAVGAVVVLRADGGPKARPAEPAVPAGPVASATVASSAVGPDTSGEVVGDLWYPVQAGDTVVGIAYLLCTSPESLSGANGWPDAAAQVLMPSDLVAVPVDACIQGGGWPGRAAAEASGSVPVLGDVEASGIAAALRSGGVLVSDLTEPASGLARADYFDWIARVDELVPTFDQGTPVVVAIGGSDAQVIVGADGTDIPSGTPAWSEEYVHRVGVFTDALVGEGHPVIWVVPSPPVASDEYAQAVRPVADAIVAALGTRPGTIVVDSWDVLRGPDGDAASVTALDSDGAPVVVRADGVITAAGDQLLADRVAAALMMLAVDGQTARAPASPPAATTTTSADTAAPLPTSTGGTYVVIPGDHLRGIATKAATTVDALVRVNGWLEGTDHLIFPGDVIALP